MSKGKLLDEISVDDIVQWGPCPRYCSDNGIGPPDPYLIRAGLGGWTSVTVRNVFDLNLSPGDKLWLLVRREVLTYGEAIALRHMLIRHKLVEMLGTNGLPPDLAAWEKLPVSCGYKAFDLGEPIVAEIKTMFARRELGAGNNIRACIVRDGGSAYDLAMHSISTLYPMSYCDYVFNAIWYLLAVRRSKVEGRTSE